MLKRIYKSILSLIIGHLTVFKHAFKKRVTLEYPEIKPALNDKFRGKHTFDINKCKACGMCQKVCPANAITLEDGKPVIDPEKCIHCNKCIGACPNGTISRL